MPSSVTFERQIEIIRHKFRKDAAALAFVDSFDAAIEEIDEWFGVSGLMRNGKLRTLTRTVVFQAGGDLRRRLIRALLTRYSSVDFLKWYVINIQYRRGSTQNGKRNGERIGNARSGSKSCTPARACPVSAHRCW